jgi:hypothetical protein
VTGSCEHSNDVSGSIKFEEFLGHLIDDYFPQKAVSFQCKFKIKLPLCLDN